MLVLYNVVRPVRCQGLVRHVQPAKHQDEYKQLSIDVE